MRILVAWFPNWPVTALGFGDDELVAVIEKDRVVASSRAARAVGVTAGQRRRQAEHACPKLAIAPRDYALEARAFEPLAAAIGTMTPFVEVTRPGYCALAVRGPARYFGGEAGLCEKLADVTRHVGLKIGSPPLRLGIAEGRFAAGLAARRGVVVPKKKTASFLAPFSITVLGEPDLVDLLVRLGIRNLGVFAALPEASVSARFGALGVIAHRRARGLDDEELHPALLGEELAVKNTFDPPAERVDVAAFAARAMADDLMQKLEKKAMSCARIRIEAETEHGEVLSRLWRGEESFTSQAIVERLRWQLEGWLAGTVPESTPTGGITVLCIVADEVGPAVGRQLGFFGERSDADARAARSLDRLRGLLGPHAVFTAVLRGGRGPADRVAWIPWGEPGPAPEKGEPWPGHHPLPAPALVYETPVLAEVHDAHDEPVRVLTRGVVPTAPQRISIHGGPWIEVIAWSGPWLSDERPWDARVRKRRSRFQILTKDNIGHLCVVEANRWSIEATYD